MSSTVSSRLLTAFGVIVGVGIYVFLGTHDVFELCGRLHDQPCWGAGSPTRDILEDPGGTGRYYGEIRRLIISGAGGLLAWGTVIVVSGWIGFDTFDPSKNWPELK